MSINPVRRTFNIDLGTCSNEKSANYIDKVKKKYKGMEKPKDCYIPMEEKHTQA